MKCNNELRIEIGGVDLCIGNCLGKVQRFCSYDAYKGYDLKGRLYSKEPNVFQRELLEAANVSMRAKSSVKVWAPLIGTPIPPLAAIAPDADLIDSSDEDYAKLRATLEDCYNGMIRSGIGDVAASKMLHLKRPNFVAISDGYIKRALDVQCTRYADQAMAVSDGVRRLGIANRELLTDLQGQLAARPEPITLSKVRLIDILIGTYMSEEFGLYEGIFDAGCVKFGEFTLKSGIVSPVYCDLRMLVSSPEVLAEIGDLMGAKAREIGCDRVAGIPYGGVPIAVAASIASGIPMIYPRKEVKDHGTRNAIEGTYNAGEKVLVIDDLVTSGLSFNEAVEPLKAAGLIVEDVLVILDREQGGATVIEKAGYKLHSLGTLPGMVDVLVAAGKIEPEMREKVAEFISANQFA